MASKEPKYISVRYTGRVDQAYWAINVWAAIGSTRAPIQVEVVTEDTYMFKSLYVPSKLFELAAPTPLQFLHKLRTK